MRVTLLVLAGCAPVVPLPLPTDLDSGTEILSFAQGGRTEYHVVDLSDGTLTIEFDLREEGLLEALILAESPDELALSRGAFVPSPDDAPWRPIPGTILTAHTAIVARGGEAGSWVDASTTALPLASIRMPGLDLPACLDHGGCRVGEASCAIPCPVTHVATPQAPAPISAAACGAWFTTTVAGVDTCAPWPSVQRLDCPSPAAHFTGTASCRPILAQCPASGFSPDLPGDRPIMYASDTPSLIAALATVPADGIVALSPGSYGEIAVADQTVFGTCPDNTRFDRITITGPAQLIRVSAGSLEVSGAATLREMMVEGAVRGSGSIDVARSIFRGDVELASGVLDGSVVLGASRFSAGLRSTESALAGRVGLGGQSELVRGAIGGADLSGDVDLESVWIFLDGEGVVSNAALNADHVKIVGRATRALMLAGGPPSSFTDLLVDTRAIGGPRALMSIASRVRIERARVLHDHCFGLQITARGVELADVAITTRYTVDTSTAACDAIQVESEAELTIERISITDSGARAIDVRGTLTACDVDILATGIISSDVESRGIQVSSVAGKPLGDATITRLRIDGAEAAGLNARNGNIRATDVSIFRTRQRANDEDTGTGDAFGVYQSGTLEIERFIAKDNTGAGAVVFTTPEGGLEMRDGVIRGNSAGVSLDNSSYNFCRLLDTVAFDNTGINLDPAPPANLDCRE